ncbi:glyoxalase [Aneurinibacillus migulanus]|uniref:VOC family protein n=1 Tax=Aneurinibacillus migulanus TaxID=47500 RepID=UPI0005B9F6F6|nr:VOC family protein [Aneurinibacillus migulanus]KIV50866.1 glyoxalase [Aneurinibacillus migulanus]KPD09609.1 glyoxalase [Aneurinibacillus migulanus]MCP1354890.1 VOC family protein [Aneurinibacillus migulanus]MED4727474.1 VOC family protein [Aneurinibacillus migulanus]CEH31613.1 Lactoylglutathione lyase-like lyase [Aneurinibacillus migulanus]
MGVRRIEHVCIMVKNLEKSIRFYQDVVGLDLIKKMGHPNPELKLAFLGFEESQETIMELIEGYNNNLPAEGKVHHICFKVDSLEEEIERLKSLDITFLTEEIETLPDGSRYIFFAGADGEWIEFFETTR